MTLEEQVKVLQSADLLRIIKDGKDVFAGFLAIMCLHNGNEFGGEIIEKYGQDTVKSMRCVPEITHKEWKKRGLMSPLQPDEVAEYRFSDLQMKLYYTIYI